MKKSLLAFAGISVLGACAVAHAQQTNVTLYGLIDSTVRSVNNSNAAGGTAVGFFTPWFSGSRWGLRGTEDLGGGLKSIFKLESEFVIGTGEMDTPGVLFNRDAWVGLQSESFGKVTLGRQNAIGRDISGIYGDPYGSHDVNTEEGGYTNTNNFKQLVFYGGSVTGTREDNAIVWKKLFSNGIFAGYGHQLGQVVGDISKNTTDTLALGYNGQTYSVGGFYTRANVSNRTHQSYSVGGNVGFGLVRLYGGYYHYTADQGTVGERKDDAYTVSAKLTPTGPFDYELGYQVIKTKNGAFNAAGTSTLNPFADAGTATATGSGNKATLYGSVFYHLSKRTELYVAADFMKLKGNYRVSGTNGFDKQTELALGMRTRF
jgi:predicted porin